MTTTCNITALAVNERHMNQETTLRQIGHMNVLAISGGRVYRTGEGIELPVSSGYTVRVTLAANDTYTVQRIMRRGVKTWIKGTVTGVYAEDLGETCYVASCYKNRDFG